MARCSRLCSPTYGWKENPIFAKLQKALTIAGCARVDIGAGLVLFNFINSEAQAREFETIIGPIITDIQRVQSDEERRIAILMGLKEIRDYFSKYALESGALDFVFLGTAYHVMGKEKSH